MQTLETIKEIVARIEFRDWDFYVGDLYLQVQFREPDFYTGKIGVQKCRKWQLSYYTIGSEIVRTAYKAALIHEVQEQFKYKDAQIYHPHFDVEETVKFAKQRKADYRNKGLARKT